MILPPGQCIKSAIDLASLDFPALLSELAKKSFTGYLSMTIRGIGGIEEGTLVFDGGRIVACAYEYFKYDILLLGSDAFPRVINASAAKKGVVDLYQISTDQVKLVIAFNEKIVFVPNSADLANVTVAEFSPFFEEQVKTGGEDNRSDLLKKFKLGDTEKQVGRRESAEVPKEEGSEEDMFEKLIKKA